MIKVGINGYGVIGKRIADAVMLQDDMELVGVTARTADFRLWPTKKLGVQVYGVDEDAVEKISKFGISVAGNLDSLLQKIDVIIDTTPKGVGAANKPIYDKAGIKSIFQGGEDHELTGKSFTAQTNYQDSVGVTSTRVVSCNTTGISRVLSNFIEQEMIEHADISLIRRAVDPIDSHKKGIINTVVLATSSPSHHGDDVKTVINNNLSITTLAAVAAHNLSHFHQVFLTMKKEVTKADVVRSLKETSRVVLIKRADGLVGLHSLIELMKDLKRPRNDMWEVAIWENTISIEGRHVAFAYQVHNESIVVPDNIDAIRAVTGSENAQESMMKTDAALGLLRSFEF